jgi:hypothetical protein
VGNGLTHYFYSFTATTETPMELNELNDATTPMDALDFEITTRQAAERYGCENNYSTFHNRMTKLGIKPERRGRASYLSTTQIQLLDKLDGHLRNGGTFSNFVIEEGEVTPITKNDKVMELATTTDSSIVSNSSIGSVEIIAALQALSNSNYDVLTPQKRLKEAAEEGFLLTTEQISKIVGLAPSTISSWKSGTKKLGFSFSKEHEGSSVVWRVIR